MVWRRENKKYNILYLCCFFLWGWDFISWYFGGDRRVFNSLYLFMFGLEIGCFVLFCFVCGGGEVLYEGIVLMYLV